MRPARPPTVTSTCAGGRCPQGILSRDAAQNGGNQNGLVRADIGMSYRLFDNQDGSRHSIFRNVWLGVDCLNLFGISNVNSYYWITDISGQQYAVPNYLTGRQINAKLSVEF